MKETDFGEAIRSGRNALGMNQAALAEAVGVSRNTVAGWETGHSRPDLRTVPKLCRALDMSLEAFFGTETQRSSEENRLLQLFRSLEAPDREAMIWQMAALADGRKRQRKVSAPDIPCGKAKALPVSLPGIVTLHRSRLGVAAGVGTALADDPGDEILLLADRMTEAADEVIAVSGDSMEPTFFDGDLVLVKHTERIRPGEIGVFLVEDEGYIKEYREDGLHSHNPDYRTMQFTGEEHVRCIGRVLGKVEEAQIPNREQLKQMEEAREGRERGSNDE